MIGMVWIIIIRGYVSTSTTKKALVTVKRIPTAIRGYQRVELFERQVGAFKMHPLITYITRDTILSICYTRITTSNARVLKHPFFIDTLGFKGAGGVRH